MFKCKKENPPRFISVQKDVKRYLVEVEYIDGRKFSTEIVGNKNATAEERFEWLCDTARHSVLALPNYWDEYKGVEIGTAKKLSVIQSDSHYVAVLMKE